MPYGGIYFFFQSDIDILINDKFFNLSLKFSINFYQRFLSNYMYKFSLQMVEIFYKGNLDSE